MIAVLCLLVAAALLFGVDVPKLKAWLEVAKTKIDAKRMLAAGLLIIAFLALPSWSREDQPTPVPDNGPLSLKGDFRGETASADASTVGNLLIELADEIEWDSRRSEPYFVTGSQIDQLRKAARVLRCSGESIGERQPVARDKIAAYLESHVGTDGGPLTQETRALWISAFRDVGRAASEAAQ
jgi:hypothetical protein